MSERHVYDVVVPPEGPLYETLLRSSAHFAALFGVVVRSELVHLSEAADRLLSSLARHVVQSGRHC